MKSVRTGTFLGIAFVLATPFVVVGQEPTCLEDKTCTSNGTVVGVEPENNFSAQKVADERCAAGVGAENDFLPFRPGVTCLVTPAPDASALECKGIENPTVVSKCDGGKCVAKEMCKKPLAAKPIEIPGGSSGDDPLKPAPTPTPSKPAPSPTPSTPQPSTPSPSPSIPSGGSSGGNASGGTLTPSPDGSGRDIELVNESPKVPTPTKPGTTFTDPGSPFTLKPGERPSIGGNTFGSGEYLDGVFSGGNPFGNTFGGTFGGSGSGDVAAGLNFFTNLVSTIGNLFGIGGGGLSTGSSGGSSPRPTVPTSNPTPTPAPAPQPAPVTTRPPLQAADTSANDRAKVLEDRLRKMNEARGTDINKGISSNGGVTPKNLFEGVPLAPLKPTDRIGLPTVGSGEPLIGGTPRGTLPTGVVEDATDLGGITVPIPDPVPVPTRPNPVPGGNSFPITRDTAAAEVIRTREALDDRSTLDRLFDWVGIGSDEGVAYQRALRDLAALAKQENLNVLALQQVRAMPGGVQVAEGGPVMTDAAPMGLENIKDLEYIENFEKQLTPAQREQLEAEYQKFLREFDAATPERQQQMFDEVEKENIRAHEAIDKAFGKGRYIPRWVPSEPLVPPTPQPALSSSRMLEGLSKIGERVADAARAAAERLGALFSVGASIPPDTQIPTVIDQVSSNPPLVTLPQTSLEQPLPEPEKTAQPAPPAKSDDTKAPTPPPAPAPAPSQPTPQPTQVSRPSGLLQGGISLLGALINGISNFFRGNDEPVAPVQPAQPAQPITAAASITVNPSTIDDGDTTKLSWTSVGTLSCVVVDSTLNVIKRGGTDGDLVTPALSTSTRFGVICDIEGGKDKFINETLVRVGSDTNEPTKLFAQTGRASSASPASGGSNGASVTGGTQGGLTSNPVDVRTCDPEQSIDSFVKCLCEAEPNPNGCALVQ